MSSALLVQPTRFFMNDSKESNPFAKPLREVSTMTESMDTGKVCNLVGDMETALRKYGVEARTVQLIHEKKHTQYVYEMKGEAVLAGHTMSMHNFVDDAGVITRRLVILYPVCPFRQEEFGKKQVEAPLNADESDTEIVDLRGFQRSGKYLEGLASLVFSADGKFVYMARSGHSDEDVLDVLCSPENLNIPPENRFVFDAFIPTPTGSTRIPYTNMLGWCGWGISAWCLDFIKFDDPDEQERFYSHLEKEYEVVVELTPNEIFGFAAAAFEVTSPTGECTLLISEKGRSSLCGANMKALRNWYGPNIAGIYSEVLERRCGVSFVSAIIASKTHGPVPPNSAQESTLSILKIPGSTR